jgi:hypothetical protein
MACGGTESSGCSGELCSYEGNTIEAELAQNGLKHDIYVQTGVNVSPEQLIELSQRFTQDIAKVDTITGVNANKRIKYVIIAEERGYFRFETPDTIYVPIEDNVEDMCYSAAHEYVHLLQCQVGGIDKWEREGLATWIAASIYDVTYPYYPQDAEWDDSFADYSAAYHLINDIYETEGNKEFIKSYFEA